MTDPKTDAHLKAMADTLGLTIEPEWAEGVGRFFETARDMAALVRASGAGETVEPGPIFTPQGFDAVTAPLEPAP